MKIPLFLGVIMPLLLLLTPWEINGFESYRYVPRSPITWHEYESQSIDWRGVWFYWPFCKVKKVWSNIEYCQPPTVFWMIGKRHEYESLSMDWCKIRLVRLHQSIEYSNIKVVKEFPFNSCGSAAAFSVGVLLFLV